VPSFPCRNALYTFSRNFAANYIKQKSAGLSSGWLRREYATLFLFFTEVCAITHMISLKRRNNQRVLDLYRLIDRAYLHQQIEERDGQLYMRMKKRMVIA